jgi:MFS family permease
MSETSGKQNSRRTIILATILGTSIEWYDFNIYGIAAALVIGPQFFPKISDTAGTIAAFATFTVGFVARPFGAALFGHFGDRLGRKNSLVASIILVGFGTFAIGLLPTYNAIGIWAPILLVTCRFIQGIGVGGEWGGAALMAAENAPKEQRGSYAGWPQFGSPAGLLLAEVVFFSVHSSISSAAFQDWGWRVPFLLSIVLVVVGLGIRLTLQESPFFEKKKRAGHIEAVPLFTLFRVYPKQVALVAGAHLLNTTAFFLVTTYTLTYAKGIPGIAGDSNIGLIAQIAGSIMLAIGIPIMSHLSDRYGRKWVVLPLYLSWLVWIWPMFWLIQMGTLWSFVTAVAVGTFLTSAYGPLGAQYLEQFDSRVRYTGAGLAQYIGSIFGGGISPLAATKLNAWGGIAAVQVYVMIVAVIASSCVFMMREGAGVELEDLDDLDIAAKEPFASGEDLSVLRWTGSQDDTRNRADPV